MQLRTKLLALVLFVGATAVLWGDDATYFQCLVGAANTFDTCMANADRSADSARSAADAAYFWRTISVLSAAGPHPRSSVRVFHV
jgi:hypothetical protein